MLEACHDVLLDEESEGLQLCFLLNLAFETPDIYENFSLSFKSNSKSFNACSTDKSEEDKPGYGKSRVVGGSINQKRIVRVDHKLRHPSLQLPYFILHIP